MSWLRPLRIALISSSTLAAAYGSITRSTGETLLKKHESGPTRRPRNSQTCFIPPDAGRSGVEKVSVSALAQRRRQQATAHHRLTGPIIVYTGAGFCRGFQLFVLMTAQFHQPILSRIRWAPPVTNTWRTEGVRGSPSSPREAIVANGLRRTPHNSPKSPRESGAAPVADAIADLRNAEIAVAQ